MSDTRDDEEARNKEKEQLEQTDNGWQEGDPLSQPDNPEETWSVDDDS